MSRVAIRRVRTHIEAEREGLEGIRLYGCHCRAESYETAIKRLEMLERFGQSLTVADVTDVREHLERLRDIWLYRDEK